MGGGGWNPKAPRHPASPGDHPRPAGLSAGAERAAATPRSRQTPSRAGRQEPLLRRKTRNRDGSPPGWEREEEQENWIKLDRKVSLHWENLAIVSK